MTETGALAELQAGSVGEAFAGELRRTIRAVAVSRNFPPPEGFVSWDADAVGSTVSEFLSDAQTPRRLADLALHCATDEGLRARLQGAVRNFLADLGRRTPIGKLVVRINDVLSGQAEFVRVDGRWARRGDGAAAGPGAEDPDVLARAIAGLEIVAPAWGYEAKREAPVADRETVVALCGALLDAADGSLAPRALARAIGHRLGLGQAPLSLEADGFDGPAGGGGGGADTANEAVRYVRATEVLGELNGRERLSMAFPELTVRDLGPVLGVSASQSHLVRRRAAEIVRTELVDDDDAEAIALLVMELARVWAETVDKDATSAVLVVR